MSLSPGHRSDWEGVSASTDGVGEQGSMCCCTAPLLPHGLVPMPKGRGRLRTDLRWPSSIEWGCGYILSQPVVSEEVTGVRMGFPGAPVPAAPAGPTTILPTQVCRQTYHGESHVVWLWLPTLGHGGVWQCLTVWVRDRVSPSRCVCAVWWPLLWLVSWS